MSVDQHGTVDSSSAHLIDTIFHGIEYGHEHDSGGGVRGRDIPEYPEALLQQTDRANKFYSSLQSHTKQFIASRRDSNNAMVRWNDSFIESTQRLIIDSWTGADQKGSQKNSNKTLSKANSLFSWSSSDAYIEEKKRQLKLRRALATNSNSTSNGDHNATSEKSIVTEVIPENKEIIKRDKELKKLNLKVSTASVANKLSRIVENESNKFIHARIQRIKAHHSEQINQEIHDRKKRDHETYLRKLKMKEAEYERELQEATLNREKHSFFSSLFGFNATTSKSDFDAQSRSSIDSETSIATSTNQTSTSSKNKNRFSFLPVVSMWGSPSSANGKARSNDSLTVKKDSKVVENLPEQASAGVLDRVPTPQIVVSEPDQVQASDESKPELETPSPVDNGEEEESSEEEEFSEFAATPPPTIDPTSTSPDKNESPKSIPSQTNYKFMSIDDSITSPTSKINADLVDLFGSSNNNTAAANNTTTTTTAATTTNDNNDNTLVNL